MNARRVALLAAVSLLAACGRSKPAAPRAPARPAVAAVPPAQPDPSVVASVQATEPAAPQWSYTSVGKRDPFRSFLSEVARSSAGIRARCTTPLGRFELEQLKLVAVITGLEDPVAMVEAPTGVGYSVRRGACIGKNGGAVAAVRSGEVIVSEWAMRADGTRDRTKTVLRLPKEPALKLEE